MNSKVLVCMLGLALAGGCKKQKEADAHETQGAGSAAPVNTAAVDVGKGSAAETPAADPKLIERGQYLADMLGCAFCHMPMGPKGPDFSRLYAGGMEVPEKFGTWRAPNITPHKGSGIGAWTDEQILAAVREGVRPDGSRLFPIMPYLNYNRMTDADGKALVAFLRTIPAVDNVVPPNKDLKLPQIPAPPPANAPDPVDDPVKHGEYLVTLMHCNMCHSPMTPEGAPDMTKQFAGGMEFELPMLGTGKLFASNITADLETGLGKWSKEDIAKAIKTMTRPDGSPIYGPMQFYLAGWSKMADADLDAIATYVKSIPAVKHKVPKSTFKPTVAMGPPPGADGIPAAGAAAPADPNARPHK